MAGTGICGGKIALHTIQRDGAKSPGRAEVSDAINPVHLFVTEQEDRIGGDTIWVLSTQAMKVAPLCILQRFGECHD